MTEGWDGARVRMREFGAVHREELIKSRKVNA